MENKITLKFHVSGQTATAQGSYRIASNTVDYVDAVFNLCDGWDEFDSVRAIWQGKAGCIATILDSNGRCIVPYELLADTGRVEVNLVGSSVEEDVVTDRLTTYPIIAIRVDADAAITGGESCPPTPSEYEQFVEAVKAEAASIRDLTVSAETVSSEDPAAVTKTYDEETGVYNLAFDIPAGPAGPEGQRGAEGEPGPAGTRGGEWMRVTTAWPQAYTDPVGDFNPRYKWDKVAILTETGKTDLISGDIIVRGTQFYVVGAVDDTYAYTTAGTQLKGDPGDPGIQGPPGDDYVLTAQDKQDIADIVIAEIGSADTTQY